jgi:hypothetical protein
VTRENVVGTGKRMVQTRALRKEGYYEGYVEASRASSASTRGWSNGNKSSKRIAQGFLRRKE